MLNKSQATGNGTAASRGSILSADLVITGVIASEGTVELHGKVDGEIVAEQLLLGPDGHVKGSIRATQADLHGTVEGEISCLSLVLHATARAAVQVMTERLVIESGAEVEGRFSRPAPEAPKPTTPANPAPASSAQANPAASEKSAENPAEPAKPATDAAKPDKG